MYIKQILFCEAISFILGGIQVVTATAEAQDEEAVEVQQEATAFKKAPDNQAEELEQAINGVAEVYGQIGKGSAAALNQIAAAFYALGERWEKQNDKEKAKEFFEKSVGFFDKSVQAGCKEALYNKGLAHNHLHQYQEAAACYQTCIEQCGSTEKDTDLALKSAGNWAVLILNHRVTATVPEVRKLLVLGTKNKKHQRSGMLLETAMVILTEMTQTDSAPNAVSQKATIQKTALKSSPTKAKAESAPVNEPEPDEQD